MMGTPQHRLLLTVLLALLTVPTVLTQAGGERLIRVRPTETYTYAPSQFRFPPKVGGFERDKIIQNDRDGLDVSVGYNHPGHAITATVFVYPIRGRPPHDTLEGSFGSAKAAIVAAHPDAKLVFESAVKMLVGGEERSGRRAGFLITGEFAGRRLLLRSELHVFKYGRWFVKYRFTDPGRASLSIFGQFIYELGLDWPP